MAGSTNSFSMIGSHRVLSRLYAACITLLIASFAFQLWFHATRTSATVDEPVHILAGHRHWECGDFGINPEHPPLLKLLATMPLETRNFAEPPPACGSRVTSKPDSFLLGTKFLIENDVDSVVIPARLSAALMSLILAILVFAATWKMFGRWETLTALALLAFEPNLIANGALVTTDMALSATAFCGVYAIYCFRQKSNATRFVVAGLAVGLMIAAKHSAVIFVPILLALLITDVVIFGSNETRLPKRVFRQTAAFAGMSLIGLALLWSLYGFRYRAVPNASAERVSVADYIKTNGRPEMVNSLSAQIVTSLNQTHVFPEAYVLGLADIVATGSRNMYLFDRAYPTGQWFYFPLSFLIKSSVALLLLLPLGFLFPLFNRRKRREMMFILAPPIFFFAAALTSGINIGVRHILPVYPFFIVAAAVGAVWISRKGPVLRYALVLLLLFHAVTTTFRVAPDYIPFVNDFWGGTDNVYRIFRDPNLDFGQNNKFVKEYLERQGITDCWFAAHGNPELISVSQPCRLLPGSFRLNFSDKLEEPVPSVIEGTVLLTAMVFPPRGGNEYSPIIQTKPAARIGRAVFVYRGRFEVPLVAALSHAERANQLVRLNRFEEALVDARKATELSADDPRTHLALGVALARAKRTDEARSELESAIELAKSAAMFRNAEVRARQELERLR